MSYNLQFSPYNEHSILVQWPAIINEKVLQDVLKYKIRIENNSVKDIVEVVSSYCSILIVYKSTIDNVNDEVVLLKQLYNVQDDMQLIEPRTLKVPVCYEDEFAMDLDDYSMEKKRPKADIIKLHSETVYTVFFIGFLPGFLYLGGLDKKLYLDRKKTPNLNVKKGSVGIGGKQTGIYPQDSPGGWHIIGNCPLELFNPKQNPPCFINAGDKIKFKPISKREYMTIQNEINSSNFNMENLIVND